MMKSKPEALPASMAERIMDSAESLLAQRGYHGFSYDDVAQQVGIKKPSIHHHFAKKEILAAAIVHRYSLGFQGHLKDIEDTNNTVKARLEAYAELFQQTYQSERKLCVCGMLGAEAAALPVLVNQEVQNFFQMNLAWLTSIIATAESDGLDTTRQQAESRAFVFLSVLEGSMVVGRGLQDRRGPIDVAQVWLGCFYP